MRGLPAEGTWRKLTRSWRRGLPVFDDLRRCSGAEWKRGPAALVAGGAGMERSGTGLNWRSQAPSAADVSVEVPSGDSSAFPASSRSATGRFFTPVFNTPTNARM